MTKLIIKLTLPLWLLLAACGGGGGGGGSKSNSLVIVKTNTGTCIGAIISSTSILIPAHCIVNAKTIDIYHANGSYGAKQITYYYPKSYKAENIPFIDHWCEAGHGTFDVNDIAIIKVDANYTNAIGAKPLALNISESINPGEHLTVIGLNNNLDYESEKVNFRGFIGQKYLALNNPIENNVLKRGGEPLISKNSIIGIQSCTSVFSFTGPYWWSTFTDIRHNGNYEFIKSLASDVAEKSNFDLAIETGIIENN